VFRGGAWLQHAFLVLGLGEGGGGMPWLLRKAAPVYHLWTLGTAVRAGGAL